MNAELVSGAPFLVAVSLWIACIISRGGATSGAADFEEFTTVVERSMTPPSVAPFNAKGRGLLRPLSRSQAQPRKANLKPYHWLKLTRAMQGSLWAEAQKSDEASKYASFFY